MISIWKIGAAAVVAAMIAFAGTAPSRAQGIVDCNAGGSIQSALFLGNTFVHFTGTCNEFVSIVQDGTFIQGVSGDCSLDVINGGLLAVGTQRNQIRDLTVKGSGVSILDGAYVNIDNVAVVETDAGFVVVRGSNVRIRNSTFGPALIDDANVGCNPVCIGDNSYARIQNTTITGDTNDPNIGGALSIFRDGSVILRGANTITNTGTEPAVGVFFDSSLRQDDTSGVNPAEINGSVFLQGMSYVDLRAVALTGDAEVDLNSVLRLGSTGFGGQPDLTVVNGNITLSRDSTLAVEDPAVTINGQITCADPESSLSGTASGAATTNCTGFAQRRVKATR